MISYKKVAKYKYTKNPSDVVALKEYILYEDEKNECRHAVLKFFNNLDQSLFGLQFEVYQYDSGDNLIAKSLVVCDKFTAEAGTEFVPKAKLKLSMNCDSIAVKLITADFDRIRWDKGNFTDNSYKFERYVQDAKPAVEPRGEQPAPQIAYAAPQQKPKKRYATFAIRDIFSKNLAKFPRVFAVIAVLLVVAFTVATSLVFVRSSNRFSIGEYDLYLNTGSYVTLMAYDGKDKDVVIPAEINGFKVTAISGGAFVKSDITSVKIEGDLTVYEGAFSECDKLIAVTSDKNVVMLEYAFDRCANIERVNMPNSSVRQNSFFGSLKLNPYNFKIGRNLADNLNEVLGIEEEEK